MDLITLLSLGEGGVPKHTPYAISIIRFADK
jgi:hypothetical protein